jgi:hypothetical protein
MANACGGRPATGTAYAPPRNRRTPRPSSTTATAGWPGSQRYTKTSSIGAHVPSPRRASSTATGVSTAGGRQVSVTAGAGAGEGAGASDGLSAAFAE